MMRVEIVLELLLCRAAGNKKKCCTLRERQALYGKVLKQPAQPSGTSYRYQTLNRYTAYTARLHISGLGRVLNGIFNSEQDEC